MRIVGCEIDPGDAEFQISASRPARRPARGPGADRVRPSGRATAGSRQSIESARRPAGRSGREGRTHDRRPEACGIRQAGLAGRSPAVRLAGRAAAARPRLAAVLLGPAGAGLGAAGLVRRRRWPPGSWPGGPGCPGASSPSLSSPTSPRPPTRSARVRSRSIPRRTAVPMIAGSLAVLLYLPVLLTLVDDRLAGLRAGPDAERLPGQLLGLSRRRPAARTLGLAATAAARAGSMRPGSSPWPARKSSGPGTSGGSTARSPGSSPPSAIDGLAPGLPLQGPRRPGPGRARGRRRCRPPPTGSLVLVAPGPDHRPRLGPVLSRLGSPPAVSRDAPPALASPNGRGPRIAISARPDASPILVDPPRPAGNGAPRLGSDRSPTVTPACASDGIARAGSFRHNETHADSIATRPIGGERRRRVGGLIEQDCQLTELVRASARRASRESGIVLSRIWAPWRAQYIHEAAASPEPPGGCFLCRGLAGDRRSRELPRRSAARTPSSCSIVIRTIMDISSSPPASIGGRSASSRARTCSSRSRSCAG